MAKSKREERKRKLVSARRRVEKRAAGGRMHLNIPDGVNMFQVKDEKSRNIDIIPYEVGKGNPYADEGELYSERTYYTHRGVGANNDMVVCSAKTFGRPCYICQYKAKLERDGADQKLIDSLNPKERQLWNVYDHGDKERGVQVWDQSVHLFGKFLDKKVSKADEVDGYDLYADPEKGYTLKISPTEEKGGGYSFFECSDIEFKPRREPLSDEILNQAHNLDEMIKELPYNEVKRIFLQTTVGDEDAPQVNGKAKNRSDDEDDTEDFDEPEDSDDATISLGDSVNFEYRGKTRSGEVVSLDKGKQMARVESDDREEPYTVRISELSLVGHEAKKEEDDEDDKVHTPPARVVVKTAPIRKPPVEDDDEDEPDDGDDDDEDDDPDEEDSDDDDEPPKKRGRK